MNEPNNTVDPVMPPQGRASVWWNVRPMLQVALIAEVLAVAALFRADATPATIVRAWLRSIVITSEQVQMAITALAIVSVIAVVIEAARKGRFSPRRNGGEELKVASA